MGILASRLIIPYVTALPSSPYDGQEIYYGADASNGIIWHLRYNAAGGTYKWEFIGGSCLDTLVSAAATKGSGTTFAALSDSLPTITIPLAGDYLVKWAANGGNSANAPTFNSFIGIKNNATNPADADCTNFAFLSRTTTTNRRDLINNLGSAERTITVATAGHVLQMVCRKDASTPTISIERRFMSARPIRVG